MGKKFFEFELMMRTHCNCCNCFRETDGGCDALDGRESIKEAECYLDALHYAPSEHLQIELE